jgi:3-(methylthio)propionyl---CoA ligase
LRRREEERYAPGIDDGSAPADFRHHRRHLEAYYTVSGSGMIMHTCNPRLHPDQLIYTINHAEDRVLLFDTTFGALIQKLAPGVNHEG